MAVFRVEKTKGYTVMSNHHLHNRNLSFKAKGLLSFMLSLPENWNYTEHGLSQFAKDGEEALWLILGDWIHTNVILEMNNVMNAYLDKPTTETAKAFVEYYDAVFNDSDEELKELVQDFFSGIDATYKEAKEYLAEGAKQSSPQNGKKPQIPVMIPP